MELSEAAKTCDRSGLDIMDTNPPKQADSSYLSQWLIIGPQSYQIHFPEFKPSYLDRATSSALEKHCSARTRIHSCHLASDLHQCSDMM